MILYVKFIYVITVYAEIKHNSPAPSFIIVHCVKFRLKIEELDIMTKLIKINNPISCNKVNSGKLF